MLTVAKVTASAAGGYAQYLEGRSQAPQAGDYYLSEPESTDGLPRVRVGRGVGSFRA